MSTYNGPRSIEEESEAIEDAIEDAYTRLLELDGQGPRP